MPFTVGQYLTVNDLKSQEDAHTLGYGVLNGLKVVPTDPVSMDVQVETGKAYVADTLVEKGAVTDLTVSGADPTNPRKDIVVCNSAGTLSIVAGTPEAALPSDKVGVYTLKPEPPSIPANSIILAKIWVPAGATEITGSEIYEKRVSIADFLTHKGDASAHHAKYTDAEVDAIVAAHAAIAAAHHARYTDAEAQAIADAQIAIHGAIAAAHHAKFTTTEHDTTARHTLGSVVPHDSLAGLTSRPHSGLTGIGPSDHHTKYTHPTTGTCPQNPKSHTHKNLFSDGTEVNVRGTSYGLKKTFTLVKTSDHKGLTIVTNLKSSASTLTASLDIRVNNISKATHTTQSETYVDFTDCIDISGESNGDLTIKIYLKSTSSTGRGYNKQIWGFLGIGYT